MLILATVILGTSSVAANPWTNIEQLQNLNSYQKISDITGNSLSATSSNLNDPFRNPVVQSSRLTSTPPINPFSNYVSTMSSVTPITSMTQYDSSLNDQMNQIQYSTDNAISSQLMDTYSGNVQTASLNEIRSRIYPSPKEQLESATEDRIITTLENGLHLESGTIGVPYTTLQLVDSVGKKTFERVGYSTQIMSPPPIAPSKYTSTQFGPFGIFGSQATAKSRYQDDQIRVSITDQYYTSQNSISHFYTRTTDFTNLNTYTPGVTASGSWSETSSFYTPLPQGFASLQGVGGLPLSNGMTQYPVTGFDPSDYGTRFINQQANYHIQINPGISSPSGGYGGTGRI